MAIKPRCARCHAELTGFGAILFGPPDEHDTVKKMHLCKACYRVLARDITGSI